MESELGNTGVGAVVAYCKAFILKGLS